MSDAADPPIDSAIQSTAAGPAQAVEPHEPCPTPLSWQQVMQSCSEQHVRQSLTIADRPVEVSSLGEGPAIYFLADLLPPPDLFNLIRWLLREDFCCRTVTLPWTGRSSRDGYDSVAGQARLLREVAQQLHDDRLSIYAAGFGTALALEFAALDSDRITHLILQTPFVRRRYSLLERLGIRLGRVCPGRWGQLPGAGRLLAHNHRRWFPPFDPTRFDFLFESIAGRPVREVAACAASIRNFDLRGLSLPEPPETLVIHCEGEGVLLGQATDEVCRLLPKVQVEWLHTTGLMPYLTHPHRMNKLIRSFLANELTP